MAHRKRLGPLLFLIYTRPHLVFFSSARRQLLKSLIKYYFLLTEKRFLFSWRPFGLDRFTQSTFVDRLSSVVARRSRLIGLLYFLIGKVLAFFVQVSLTQSASILLNYLFGKPLKRFILGRAWNFPLFGHCLFHDCNPWHLVRKKPFSLIIHPVFIVWRSWDLLFLFHKLGHHGLSFLSCHLTYETLSRPDAPVDNRWILSWIDCTVCTFNDLAYIRIWSLIFFDDRCLLNMVLVVDFWCTIKGV